MFKRFLSDRFIKNNLIFFVGSVAIGALNYLFYPIIGRLLSAAEFGEVQVLISIFSLVILFITIFGSTTVNIVANVTNIAERDNIISQFNKFCTIISCVVLFFLVVLSPWLKTFFNFDSVLPFVFLGLLVPLSTSVILRNAFLQGKHKFFKVSFNGILASVGKLLACVIFVVLGFGVGGVMIGLLVSQILSLIYLYKNTNKDLVITSFSKIKFTNRLKKELSYSSLIFVTIFVITFFISADVLFAKRFFSPEEAGFYSGIATIAKIIYFLSAPIVGVLFASIGLNNTRNENIVLFKKGLLILIFLGFIALLAFLFMPEFIVTVLMGIRFVGYAHLLPLLGVAIFLISIDYSFFMYYLALREKFIAKVGVAGVLITIFFCFFLNRSPINLIYSFLFGSLVMLLAFVLRISIKWYNNKVDYAK